MSETTGTAGRAESVSEGDVLDAFPRPAALPYLSVRNAADAIAWYCEVFHARQVGEPYIMPDGTVGHAELEVGGGILYLAEQFPDMGLVAPTPGAISVSLMLPVTDTDVTLEHARGCGAHVEREPSDEHGGRIAALQDPFGHRWMLFQPLTTPHD